MTTDETQRIDSRRILLLALLLTFGFAVIVGQLVRYQVLQHAQLKEQSDKQVIREKPVVPGRGYITDANGQLLALNMVEWEISADPPLIVRSARVAVANELAPRLQMPEEQLKAALNSGVGWVLLKKQVPQEVGEAIRQLNLNGIECHPMPLRVYPQADLTAHLVGFVNTMGEGFWGLEGFYNQQLRATEGSIQFEQNPVGDPTLPRHDRKTLAGGGAA